MQYDLKLNDEMEGLLRVLIVGARAAKDEPAYVPNEDELARRTRPALVEIFEVTFAKIREAADFYLGEELTAAYERFVDNFAGIGCSPRFPENRDLEGFASFLEHLLDGEARAVRPQQVSSAWSAGVNPYGYTNEELNRGIDDLLCQEAFEEIGDGDEDDELITDVLADDDLFGEDGLFG